MDYIKPFLIGGSIIATSKFVANHVSPEYGALIGGMPTGMIASFFLVGNKLKGGYYKGYLVSSVVIVLVLTILNVVLKTYSKINPDILSACSLVIWAILSFFSVKLIKNIDPTF